MRAITLSSLLVVFGAAGCLADGADVSDVSNDASDLRAKKLSYRQVDVTAGPAGFSGWSPLGLSDKAEVYGLGFTCDAAAFPDSTGYQLEVYLRLPPATLRQLARDNEGDARLRATLRVKNRYSSRELESSQDFKIALVGQPVEQTVQTIIRFCMRQALALVQP